ncbi:MAG TPA: preprotein translocase subunit YajC [Caulobacteraceae bacterium]|nr:preprotein translocase subunit YajC [Caulobacteraceae bacterium]
MTLTVILAAAPAAGAGDFFAGPIGQLLPFLAIPVLFYFMLWRPQAQRQKEHQAKVQGVKRGDTVVLSSGLIGKVVRVETDEIGLEIAQNVTVKVVKAMIQDVRVRGEPAPANDSKS